MAKYVVHSAVRKRHTRLARMQAAQHHDLVQRLDGGNLIVRRTRPVLITEERLLRLLPELRRAMQEGRIDVRTQDGRLVDLETLAVASATASKLLPHPPLDSAARDKPMGVPKPMYQEGKGQTEDVPLPTVMQERPDAGLVEEPAAEPAPAVEEASSKKKEKGKK